MENNNKKKMVWVDRVVEYDDYFSCYTKTFEENPDKDFTSLFFVERPKDPEAPTLSSTTSGAIVVERTYDEKREYNLWKLVADE